jgi:8-oxo-dGTP pyrophosphatase MutT (NUDIX family)
MEWKVLSSEYINKEPWLTTRKDVCELPNGTIMNAYYVQEFPTWVTAFALTKDNKVVLVKQYRHGLGEVCIETPGGCVDENEPLEQAIIRELKEETGYEFKSIEYLGKISPNPSTNNNLMHMYLMKEGEKVGEQSLDATEDVEVLLYSIDEVKTLLRENKIMQSLHASCMFYALNKLGELKY